MNKKEAERYAVYLWGSNAVVARSNAVGRHERFRVGYVGRATAPDSDEQRPAVYLCGMGDSWKSAFAAANENPVAKVQSERITEGRKRIQEKLKEAAEAEEVKPTQEMEKNDAEHE